MIAVTKLFLCVLVELIVLFAAGFHLHLPIVAAVFFSLAAYTVAGLVLFVAARPEAYMVPVAKVLARLDREILHARRLGKRLGNKEIIARRIRELRRQRGQLAYAQERAAHR